MQFLQQNNVEVFSEKVDKISFESEAHLPCVQQEQLKH
jgi:hypothetical protein